MYANRSGQRICKVGNRVCSEKLSQMEASRIRSCLTAAGWRFAGYTSGLPVVRGGEILKCMVEGKRCHVYLDPEKRLFMIQPFQD